MKQSSSSRLGLLDWIIVFLFASILGVVLLAIIFRYFINHSLPWSDEVVRYLFVHLTMLGIALAIRDRQHIRVEYFLSLLPEKPRRIVERFSLLLVIAFNLLLLITGIQWLFTSSGAATPALGLPRNWVFFSAVPLSAFLVIVFGIGRLRRGAYAELDATEELSDPNSEMRKIP